MRNKKGEVATAVIVTAVLINLIAGNAILKTAANGTLRNNGKKIWCKMLNKGNDFCEAEYQM